MELAEKVVLVWMGGENEELSRAEYIPGELPEEIQPPADAAYLIVEQLNGDTIHRSLYQPGDEHITVYYQGEQPWCLPNMAQINWE